MSLYRTVGLIAIMLLVLIIGTSTTVKVATDHVLDESATHTAEEWARSLSDNVKDLEQIAGGEEPSSTSMPFFQWAQRTGLVFRYLIYNREGFSQLVSDRHRIALVDVSERDTSAIRSVATKQSVVAVQKGAIAGLPDHYAVAYVPVIVNNRPIAVVAAYVDQTEERARHSKTLLLTAAALCLLTSLAFAVPSAAWYRSFQEKQRADAKIRFLAHNDAMTRLANRNTFIERLRRSIGKLPDGGSGLAVHYIDLDRFRDFNVTHGREGGDKVLTAVAEALRRLIGPENFAARLGADEFAVLQTGVASRAEAEEFARRIIACVVQPVDFKSRDLMVTASVGSALAPADSVDAERLMAYAGLALNKSRTSGGNRVCFFSGEMDTEYQARLRLEAALRDAAAKQSFELAFQGIFAPDKATLLGFEALLRLPGPNGESISPAVFIPVAEEMGLIHTIGAWVIDEACRFAATWPAGLYISVNLSPAQFAHGDVAELVEQALTRYQLEPARLQLEITESLLLNDTELVMIELRKLKNMGVMIAMDDFGTGYSSLAYLWQFPFDKLKIDRSFIWAYEGGDRDVAPVLNTIVSLGRSLDMKITMEGVETEKQAKFVRELGCDEVQGFHYARPVPATVLSAALLKKFKGKMQPAPAAAPARAAASNQG
jgi:diguanylate cyclase (GGDEF)-like protein